MRWIGQYGGLLLLLQLPPACCYSTWLQYPTPTGTRRTIKAAGSPLFSFRSAVNQEEGWQERTEQQQQQPPTVIILASSAAEGEIAVAGAKLALAVHHTLNSRAKRTAATATNEVLPTLYVSSSDDDANIRDSVLLFNTAAKDTISVQDFADIIESASSKTTTRTTKIILHAVLDRPYPALTAPALREAITFLGLVPMVPEQFLAEKAAKVGGFVQQILDVYDRNVNSRDTAVKLSSCCCISWQWPLHLALLQANALPKSTAHGDRFLLLPSRTIPDLALVEYLYDDTRLGGGRDPLACATEEVSWPHNNSPRRSPNNNGMTKASYATAAAYTVLRGCCVDDDGISSGMDAAVTAACLAHGVGMLLASGPVDPTDVRLVDHTIALAHQYRYQDLVTRPVVRQRYRDYGYR
jgi:hypothetical protein